MCVTWHDRQAAQGCAGEVMGWGARRGYHAGRLGRLASLPVNLERAVGRSSGCVPRGVQRGTMRRNSRPIPTSCNEAGHRAGRALAAVATSTQRVTIGGFLNLNSHWQLHTLRSGQLLFLGLRIAGGAVPAGAPACGNRRRTRSLACFRPPRAPASNARSPARALWVMLLAGAARIPTAGLPLLHHRLHTRLINARPSCGLPIQRIRFSVNYLRS